MSGFKLPLILYVFGAFLVLFSGLCLAQTNVPAVPPLAVEQEQLQDLAPKGPTVIELFSSQACMFCPKADALLDVLALKDNVIALACHVDYFDLREGSFRKDQ